MANALQIAITVIVLGGYITGAVIVSGRLKRTFPEPVNVSPLLDAAYMAVMALLTIAWPLSAVLLLRKQKRPTGKN